MKTHLTPEEIRALGFTWPPPDFPVDQLAIVDGRIDLPASIERLKSSAKYHDSRADDSRALANNYVNCSFFDFEDARDDAQEWRGTAYREHQAAALLEKILG